MPNAAEDICEIGRRLYSRGFTAANDGNISMRLDQERILCTPTMTSKGFMNPDDLCVVDMDGEQISGHKRRSSEVKLHLEIYRQREDVNSVVHCHPPHATAFQLPEKPFPNAYFRKWKFSLAKFPSLNTKPPAPKPFRIPLCLT